MAELRFYCYGIDPELKEKKSVYCFPYPIEKAVAESLATIAVGGIVTPPDAFLAILEKEEAFRKNVRLDQVAQMTLIHNNEIAAHYFVQGVKREGLDHGENGFRPFNFADEGWITVTQFKTGKGVFDMSWVVAARGWNGKPGMTRHVVGPHDHVLRLIGDSFRVIDPLTELGRAPVIASTAPQP
jgi:hypothetical protein